MHQLPAIAYTIFDKNPVFVKNPVLSEELIVIQCKVSLENHEIVRNDRNSRCRCIRCAFLPLRRTTLSRLPFAATDRTQIENLSHSYLIGEEIRCDHYRTPHKIVGNRPFGGRFKNVGQFVKVRGRCDDNRFIFGEMHTGRQ